MEKVRMKKNSIEGRRRKTCNTDTVAINGSAKARRTQSTGSLKARRAFTPGEDEIILNKLKAMGDDLNIKKLAEEIGRCHAAVRIRVIKLKIGEAGRNQKPFSLAEDEAIVEKVLPSLKEYKLHDVRPTDRSLDDVATALGRLNKAHSLARRWAHCLQP